MGRRLVFVRGPRSVIDTWITSSDRTSWLESEASDMKWVVLVSAVAALCAACGGGQNESATPQSSGASSSDSRPLLLTASEVGMPAVPSENDGIGSRPGTTLDRSSSVANVSPNLKVWKYDQGSDLDVLTATPTATGAAAASAIADHRYNTGDPAACWSSAPPRVEKRADAMFGGASDIVIETVRVFRSTADADRFLRIASAPDDFMKTNWRSHTLAFARPSDLREQSYSTLRCGEELAFGQATPQPCAKVPECYKTPITPNDEPGTLAVAKKGNTVVSIRTVGTPDAESLVIAALRHLTG